MPAVPILSKLNSLLRGVSASASSAGAVQTLAGEPLSLAAEQAKANPGGYGIAPPFQIKPQLDRTAFAAEVASRQWFQTFDFGNGIIAEGSQPSHTKTEYLGLPERLDGLSVLDIGSFDGFYAFEACRRGARDVLATDEYAWNSSAYTARSNFELVRDSTGLPVRDQFIRVEELAPESIGGQFDIVLFLGVLYHAPDPLGYLRRVRSVTRQYALIETVVHLLDLPRPALAYYPGNYLNNDASNFFGPNLLALEGMLKDVGFSRMDNLGIWRFRQPDRDLGELPNSSGRVVVRAWVT